MKPSDYADWKKVTILIIRNTLSVTLKKKKKKEYWQNFLIFFSRIWPTNWIKQEFTKKKIK